MVTAHDDVMAWKHFPYHCHFALEIPVNPRHKGPVMQTIGSVLVLFLGWKDNFILKLIYLNEMLPNISSSTAYRLPRYITKRCFFLPKPWGMLAKRLTYLLHSYPYVATPFGSLWCVCVQWCWSWYIPFILSLLDLVVLWLIHRHWGNLIYPHSPRVFH